MQKNEVRSKSGDNYSKRAGFLGCYHSSHEIHENKHKSEICSPFRANPVGTPAAPVRKMGFLIIFRGAGNRESR